MQPVWIGVEPATSLVAANHLSYYKTSAYRGVSMAPVKPWTELQGIYLHIAYKTFESLRLWQKKQYLVETKKKKISNKQEL